jgi:nitrogen fixation NifU-like protein
MPELDSLYREIILDHFKCPRGKKAIDCPDIAYEGYNPVCGDEVQISIKVQDGQVADVAVNSRGCAISVAAGSMLAELLPGKSLAEVEEVGRMFERLLKGETPLASEELGDLESLEGVSRFPVRIKCALLAWKTIEQAVKSFKDGRADLKVATSEEASSAVLATAAKQSGGM